MDSVHWKTSMTQSELSRWASPGEGGGAGRFYQLIYLLVKTSRNGQLSTSGREWNLKIRQRIKKRKTKQEKQDKTRKTRKSSKTRKTRKSKTQTEFSWKRNVMYWSGNSYKQRISPYKVNMLIKSTLIFDTLKHHKDFFWFSLVLLNSLIVHFPTRYKINTG